MRRPRPDELLLPSVNGRLRHGGHSARSTRAANELNTIRVLPQPGYSRVCRKVSPTHSTRLRAWTIARICVESLRCRPRSLRYPCSRSCVTNVSKRSCSLCSAHAGGCETLRAPYDQNRNPSIPAPRGISNRCGLSPHQPLVDQTTLREIAER
jgi:hypothetical protein